MTSIASSPSESGIKVVASYAASSALMKQIEQGAPADVFLSADVDWMDYGAKRNLIKNDTRLNLLGNRLVLIAPKNSKLDNVTIAPGFRSRRARRRRAHCHRRCARGPRRTLCARRRWKSSAYGQRVESKLAMAENVRAALVLVARGEAPLGIVYETDAKIDPGVKIVGIFPEDSHPPIIYPVALTADAKPDAAQYLTFLRTPDGESRFLNATASAVWQRR